MTRRAAVTQAEITRALRAFQAAGIEAEARLEPNGAIRIVPADKTESPKLDGKREIRL